MNYECLIDVWDEWLVSSFYIISFIYYSIKRKDADLISLVVPVLILGNFFLLIFIIYHLLFIVDDVPPITRLSSHCTAVDSSNLGDLR